MNNDERRQNRMANVVERNIFALLDRRKRDAEKKSAEEKVADKIARFAGSMVFVYIHLALFSLWISWNVGWLGLKPFDESLVVLAMFASVEAIFLSTFVLISQNRMSAEAEKRAELDLQVSLLTEHEITRILTMVAAMAKKMEIPEADDAEIEDLKRDVHPEKVMDTMENISSHKRFNT